MRQALAVIPARMAASRFPGKPLAAICGLPLVEHVRRRVSLSKARDVYVATCDREIADEVERHGGKAVMTANTHERCTDRIEEAVRKIEVGRDDIVVIVQGDEPLVAPEMVDALIQPMMADDRIACANLLSVIQDDADLRDVDIIKTVLDRTGRVMYYSRSPIPHVRVRKGCPLYRQTGVSAFTKTFLHQYSKLPPTALEIAESIDFLRILEHGHPILGVIWPEHTVGVDRADDIPLVECALREDARQREIFQKIAPR